MSPFLLLAVLGVALLAALVLLLRLLPLDGYGHRPPPRSHWDDLGVRPGGMV